MSAAAGKACPKCNYVRTATDTAPDWQCPGCGVAYAKAAQAPAAAPASMPVAPAGTGPDAEASTPAEAVDFMGAVKDAFANYVNFSGRATRSQFWWFMLFYFIVALVSGFLGKLIATLAMLALFLPTLAIQVRRLHDVGRSGWWLFISLVPLIGVLLLLYWSVQPSDGPNEYS